MLIKCFAAALLVVTTLSTVSCDEKMQQSEPAETPKLSAQNEYAPVDQSPLDVSYCPHEYPQQKMDGGVADAPVARIVYSRPHRKGRSIFGKDTSNLCPYGKPWRLGANEATEVEFFRPVLIAGQNVAAGKYVIYCIPYADKWVLVLNSNLYSWGLQIDPAKDVFKIEVPLAVQSPALEDFTIVFTDTAAGADLIMAWDDVKAALPVSFSK